MKVKTLAQMNAERAAKRTQLDLLDGESYQIRKIKKAASNATRHNLFTEIEERSLKPQAPSATKKPQMIFKTILEFEKDKI